MVGGLEIVVAQAIEFIVKDKPCVLHGILRTQTAHPAGKAGGRAAQHRNLAVTLCDEMGDCRFCCSPVIHTHHREVGEVQFIGDQCSQHGGNGDVCETVLEVRNTAAQKDHALGLDLPQDLLGSIDLVGVLVQVGDDAVVPIQGSGPLQLNEEDGEEDVLIAYGTVVNDIKEVSKSYKEAKLALDVGKIFFSERSVIAYSALGIGRLIYQLPIPLCKMFIREIFEGKSPDDFDEETLTTINKFFENNLNVSETSRQLYIHRNTLVYRLDKLQKSTGLDLRVFEDAITFKIALMVVKYMKYMESLEY